MFQYHSGKQGSAYKAKWSKDCPSYCPPECVPIVRKQLQKRKLKKQMSKLGNLFYIAFIPAVIIERNQLFYK